MRYPGKSFVTAGSLIALGQSGLSPFQSQAPRDRDHSETLCGLPSPWDSEPFLPQPGSLPLSPGNTDRCPALWSWPHPRGQVFRKYLLLDPGGMRWTPKDSIGPKSHQNMRQVSRSCKSAWSQSSILGLGGGVQSGPPHFVAVRLLFLLFHPVEGKYWITVSMVFLVNNK